MTFLQIAGIALASACFTGAIIVGAFLLFHRPAPAEPARHFVRTWVPLPPEQWAVAFRAWPESDPRWRATWDLLSHHLEAELAIAESLPADPHAVMQWSGRLQTLMLIRSQMLNLRRSA